MKENTILKTALICSLLGILSLFITSQFVDANAKKINQVSRDDLDSKVKIMGFVDDVYDNEKITILDVLQPSTMKVVLFKENNESYDIKKNDLIETMGKVIEYNDDLEVVGHRIRVLS